jgi:hypothetical protein
LKYLHVVHKGGAGTGAAAWYSSGSCKMILLWLRFGRLLFIPFNPFHQHVKIARNNNI